MFIGLHVDQRETKKSLERRLLSHIDIRIDAKCVSRHHTRPSKRVDICLGTLADFAFAFEPIQIIL
jgi:hypothetical protein